MAKFKVGDKVRILDGSNIDNYTGGWCMSEHIGDIGTIKKIIYDDNIGYVMHEFSCMYDERGLELAEFQVGDVVMVTHAIHNDEAASPTMKSYEGKVFTIAEKYDNDDYFLKEDEKRFIWSGKSLERLNEFKTVGSLTASKDGTSLFPIKPLDLNFEKSWFDLDLFKKYTTRKEDKPMKLTFSTTEGYRIDKSNNSKIETITTFVKINGSDNTYLGMATCDKVDYSEREGVINALANAMCHGNFDREFDKAVKDNARADKKARTCTYCGQLFDTIAEKEAHEAWHVERRKARHERYLLRKRAKEIAFEEVAQKMAKEILEGENND